MARGRLQIGPRTGVIRRSRAKRSPVGHHMSRSERISADHHSFLTEGVDALRSYFMVAELQLVDLLGVESTTSADLPATPYEPLTRVVRFLDCRGLLAVRSPPEPAISLMIITFGPQMPAAGLVNGTRSPAAC